jgi:hypothetical protein
MMNRVRINSTLFTGACVRTSTFRQKEFKRFKTELGPLMVASNLYLLADAVLLAAEPPAHPETLAPRCVSATASGSVLSGNGGRMKGRYLAGTSLISLGLATGAGWIGFGSDLWIGLRIIASLLAFVWFFVGLRALFNALRAPDF